MFTEYSQNVFRIFYPVVNSFMLKYFVIFGSCCKLFCLYIVSSCLNKYLFFIKAWTSVFHKSFYFENMAYPAV